MIAVMTTKKRNSGINIIATGTHQGTGHEVDHATPNIVANGFPAQGIQFHLRESEVNRVGYVSHSIDQCAVKIVNKEGNFFQGLMVRLFRLACGVAVGSYNIFFVEQDDHVL